MSIPTSKEIRDAILDYLADGKERRRQDIADALGSQFNLTAAELAEEHPSEGKKFYRYCSNQLLKLCKIGLVVEASEKHYWRIA